MDFHTIGVDLGGTELKAGRVGAAGEVTCFARRASRAAESATAPLEAVLAAIAEARSAARDLVRAVGLGCPGVLDPGSGSLVGRTPHLPHWDSIPVKSWLAERLDLPLVVDNDANLAALGEHLAGAARGARLSVTLTLGTGIGCGIVAGGRLVRGAFGGAGELGHVPLDGRFPCRCEVPGCVEPECSGEGLAARARERGLDVAGAEGVFAAAARGDARAAALIARMADRLGALVAIAVQLLNPDVVVIGGGVSGAGDALLSPLRDAVARYALASHRGGVRIVGAALGPRAGVTGAGLAARALLEPADG